MKKKIRPSILPFFESECEKYGAKILSKNDNGDGRMLYELDCSSKIFSVIAAEADCRRIEQKHGYKTPVVSLARIKAFGMPHHSFMTRTKDFEGYMKYVGDR